jgi:hypothetical protein
VTLHLHSGRDVNGWLMGYSERDLAIVIQPAKNGAPTSDAFYVGLSSVEALTVHETPVSAHSQDSRDTMKHDVQSGQSRPIADTEPPPNLRAELRPVAETVRVGSARIGAPAPAARPAAHEDEPGARNVPPTQAQLRRRATEVVGLLARVSGGAATFDIAWDGLRDEDYWGISDLIEGTRSALTELARDGARKRALAQINKIAFRAGRTASVSFANGVLSLTTVQGDPSRGPTGAQILESLEQLLH